MESLKSLYSNPLALNMKRLFPFLTLIFVLTACSSDDQAVVVTKSPLKEMLSFAFLKTNNTGLTQDITVTLNPAKNTDLITMPAGTNLSSLKPTFTVSKNAAVTVNNVAQSSGVTSNDFGKIVTYRVTAQDGTFKELTIEASAQVDISTIEQAP